MKDLHLSGWIQQFVTQKTLAFIRWNTELKCFYLLVQNTILDYVKAEDGDTSNPRQIRYEFTSSKFFFPSSYPNIIESDSFNLHGVD